jgi:hypothetical protein
MRPILAVLSIPRRLRTILLASSLVLEAARGSAASDPATFEPLTFEEIAATRLEPGARVEISGKYSELQDTELGLVLFPASLRVEDDRLRREILSLETLQDTLVFHTEFVALEGSKPTFRVVQVSAGPSYAELARQELEGLKKRAPSADVILRFAQRILTLEQNLARSDLHPTALSALEHYVERRERDLPTDDVQGRLDALAAVEAAIEAREFIAQKLVDLERRFPQSTGVRAKLIALGSRKFRGEWMTYEEFKRGQGFENYRGRWVTPSEKDFLETIEAFVRVNKVDAILRHRLDREYQLLGTNGQVAIGMRFEEAAQALGFPDRVYRHEIQGRVFTQWIFEEQHYYFVDGTMFKTPTDDSWLRQ